MRTAGRCGQSIQNCYSAINLVPRILGHAVDDAVAQLFSLDTVMPDVSTVVADPRDAADSMH
jgi:hypothetical protein